MNKDWYGLYGFSRLCIFRGRLDHLPCSQALLGTVALVFVLLSLIQWEILDRNLQEWSLFGALFAIISYLAAFVVYTWLLLSFMGFSERYQMTLNALLMTRIMVQLLVFPFIFLLHAPLAETSLEGTQLVFFIIYLLVALGSSLWEFLIQAYIYKQAIECNTLQSLMASVGLLAFKILAVLFWL